MGSKPAPGTRILDLLRTGNFRAMFAGVLLSRFGNAMTLVVISWLALAQGGARAVGLVLFASGVTSAAVGPVIGYLLDRLGLRVLMLADNLARGTLMLALAGLAAIGQARLPVLAGFAVAAAVLAPATEVGQSVATPALVGPAGLEAANRLLASTWYLAAWLGPALAGLILGTAGAPWVLLADASTFFAMAAAALLMPGRPEHSGPPSPGISGALSGFRLLWQLRAVALLTAVSVGVLFLDGMMEVFLPAFNKLALHQGPAQYGLLVSLTGVASLGGALLITPLAARLAPATAVAALLAVRGAAVLPLALAGSWAAAAVMVTVACVPDGCYYPILRTMQQRLIPDGIRGRVQGARAALGAAGFPLGSALGGTLIAGLGPSATAVAMAAAYAPLAATMLLAPRLMPEDPPGESADAPPAPTAGKPAES